MKQFKVGVQLFSVREALENDFEGTLKKIKDIGYDYVEFFGTCYDKPATESYGMSATEVKALLDKIGLKAISVHQDYWLFSKESQRVVDSIVDIGAEFCVLPFFNPALWREDWEGSIKVFSELSAAAKKSDLKFYYHNHSAELVKIDDEYIIDKIFKTLGPDIVNPQLDVAFFIPTELDAAEYIKKYTGRVEIVHLKDAVSSVLDTGNVKLESVPLGKGELDIPSILDACEQAGTEYIIVEQSSSPDGSLDGIIESREYLRSLGL